MEYAMPCTNFPNGYKVPCLDAIQNISSTGNTLRDHVKSSTSPKKATQHIYFHTPLPHKGQLTVRLEMNLCEYVPIAIKDLGQFWLGYMWSQIRLCHKMRQFLIKSVLLLMLSNAYLADFVLPRYSLKWPACICIWAHSTERVNRNCNIFFAWGCFCS